MEEVNSPLETSEKKDDKHLSDADCKYEKSVDIMNRRATNSKISAEDICLYISHNFKPSKPSTLTPCLRD